MNKNYENFKQNKKIRCEIYNDNFQNYKKYGFKKSYPLFFIKNYSPQVLKANMKILGATEYAVVLYRDKLPKFNNKGKMIFNWFNWERDKNANKIHPTQKPLKILKGDIEGFYKGVKNLFSNHETSNRNVNKKMD